tara:strand:+ start:190 stop:978 length:789 start_codon:yes stop_codon:yes gene_type:complete
MALTGKTPSGTYKDLLTIENSNNGVDSTLKNIRTGNGSNTSATISDRALAVKSATNNTTAFDVQNASGTSRLLVDTTNDKVKALGNYVNTQYAYFGISGGINSSWTNNTHYPVSFAGNNHSVGLQDNLTFGTGTDPLTAFTTADGTNTDASLLVPFMWYVPDSISIDNVYSLEGMTTSSANVTRMHLYSFDFTSGSTSALTSGTTLAHNTDVTNAGSEQAYLSTWSVISPTVTAGKVILAFFRMDTVADDPSVSITVKYHLT